MEADRGPIALDRHNVLSIADAMQIVMKQPNWLNFYCLIVFVLFIASLWVYPGQFWTNLGIAFACTFVPGALYHGWAAYQREKYEESRITPATSAADIARKRKLYNRTH